MRPAPGLDALDLDALDPPFHARDEAQRWLFQLHRLGIKPGLERIEELLDRLGNPQRALESVVVAGTNGKGSAAIYFDALSRAAGLRTGLYTSPHLLDLRERIQVDGALISSSSLAALVKRCRRDIEESGATFFEAMTAMALLHFAEEGVRLAVLETGLGGRLDATNAVGARAVLLTSVGEDHQHILGGSLPEIAREKLGLARPGVPFFLAPLPAEIRELALDFLQRKRAEVFDLGAIGSHDASPADTADEPAPGPHRQVLAAVVEAAWAELAGRYGWPPVEGAGDVLARTRLPGRWDRVGQRPPLIVDTAHNAPALESLLQRWMECGRREDRILVIGVMRDKQVDRVLPLIRRSAGTILVTAPRWYRSRPAAELAEALRSVPHGGSSPVEPTASVREALERARELARGIARQGGSPSILLTGSNFTVAEALDRLGIDKIHRPPHSLRWEKGEALRRRPRIAGPLDREVDA